MALSGVPRFAPMTAIFFTEEALRLFETLFCLFRAPRFTLRSTTGVARPSAARGCQL